jgi:hypothetical protein
VTSPVPPLSPGSIFADRFKILDYVREGSAGSVYSAEPISGGPPVALELVRLDATDGGAMGRFEREVESRKLESPRAAATLDWGKLSDHLAWVAMEPAPRDRPALVVTRPGPFVTAVLLSCVAAGVAIYWLLRSMHI